MLASGVFNYLARDMDYKEAGKRILYILFDPFVNVIKKLGIKPNHITIIGLVLNIWAVVHLLNYFNWPEFSYGDNLVGFGIILGFAGLMDTMDGRLARLHGLKTKFGAFFDSVIDRYSEFIMFFGLVVYFQHFENFFGMIFSFAALIGSIMVSYNRSRAEALGIDCSVGLMQRPERIVFIGLWCLLIGAFFLLDMAILNEQFGFSGFDLFTVGFVFLAISTNATALRRVIYSEQQMNKT